LGGATGRATLLPIILTRTRLVRTGRRSKPSPEKGSMDCVREGPDFCVKDVDNFDTFSDIFMVLLMHQKKKPAQEYS
jgi:hypothetical protein